ncbi:MAG: hypothetical protein M3N43_11510, partial [Actinomycetota bacterium]|nr:hypothetical protein [Actinomycetota bacterium]
GYTLPSGTVLPGGLTLPAGWTLPAGLQIPGGWSLPSVPPGLPPGWPINSIPPGFQLPANWTLPTSWTLPGPLSLPTGLTIPPGTPLPPNLPTVPPLAQTAPPPLPPAPAPIEPKKSDNTMLWVVGGLAVVAVVAVVASSSKSIGGGMLENPKGDEPWHSNASSRFGASMGRRSDLPSEFTGKAKLQRVPMVDGAYDPGGAYWGGWSDSTGGMFAAWDDDGHVFWHRAKSREQAKRELEAKGIRFKR